MRKIFLPYGVILSLLLLISCGSFFPAPEVTVDMGEIPGNFVIPGQTFTDGGPSVTLTSHNNVEGILRSVRFEAYHNGILLTSFDPTLVYPKLILEGLSIAVPLKPNSTIFDFSIPIADEVNWMFIPPPDTVISVELKLIFEGEDAFGEGKEWISDLTTFALTRIN